ncbi:collagen binding domain-containing protein [Paenibacillus sp. 1781tsa1]|uniref:collagen binding domain-containing protein n=1 Tax=Paenibacillus sp. 1781tsa1 TaxID=2953810 RepID=UPI00209E1459|nr:collagen binding domain-containing protein [Paenibacillus sp. 1781tsa1]MCP1186670.1 SpaA isopeptide-forming pilin-related protein [Paenibacillus sp. 1781tsa1]
MRKKVSIVIIALLLVTQMMQGWILTPTMHAQDELTNLPASAMSDTAVEDGAAGSGEVKEEPVILEEDKDASTPEDQEENTMHLLDAAAGPIITDQLITSVQMYNQAPQDNGNGTIEIKGDKIEDIRPRIQDEVAVVFTWGLANDTHNYSDGSTFTFNLPDKFIIGSQLKGNLDGGVGEYVVNPDGTIIFTFNELIEHAQLEGNFYVWLKFDESKMEDGLKQQIDFSSVGQRIIDVHFANTAIDKLKKSGSANKNNFNSDEIKWTVDFNQGEKAMKNAVLSDTLPTNLELKGNIEIRELEVQLNGSVKEGPVVQTEPQFPIQLGDTDKAYRVTYTTSVKAPTTAPFTNVEYQNQVELTTDQSEHNETDIGRVRVSFNEPLNKSGQDSAYDPVTQTITWKVQYNYNQQEIMQANAWIEDRFDTAKQQLINNSVNVYQVDINASGAASNRTLVNPNEYTLEAVNTGFDDGFRLHFKNDVTKAYEIEYDTQSIHRVYTNDTITNTVNMYDGTSKTGRKDIREVIFAKSVKSENFNKKEIEWQMVLNRDLQDMTDIVITDNYEGRHMKLIPGSLQVSGVNKDDFELTPDPADPTYEKGFSVRLKDGVTINTEHVITYTTSFDPTAGMPTDNEYRNSAKIDWEESDVAQAAITKSAMVKPQEYTIQNGNKKGEYSAKDKTITWTIDVNYNLFDIHEAILKDAYTGNQSFVDGSLKVHELVLQGENNVTAVGGEVALTDGQFQLNTDGKGFTLDLGNIGKAAYRIQYQTSLDGPYSVEGTYANQAVLTDGEGGEVRFNRSANVTPAHGGVYVQKTGQQIGTTDKASWTVNINPSQSYVPAGSPLTDTLSENQILLADSLKLYATNLPANNSGNVSNKAGLVDPADYELIVEGNTFTFTFNKDIHTAFILEYQSYINADHGARIENKVEFAGQSSSVVGEGNQVGIKVSLAGAGGGASTGLGKIRIHKVSDTGVPLEGAIFAIYNASGTTLLETLKPTDENGVVESSRNYRLNNLTNGVPYKLKELSAPAGYLVDPEYGSASGKTIEFKDADIAFEIENKKIRQGFELTKVDAIDSSKKLQGAAFELYLNNGATREKIDELTTGEDGKIAKGDLLPGDYELVEVVAPEFYQLDATPIPFTIVENQTQIITLTKSNAMGTGGKLVVTKVNAKDHSVLSGIEFELHDSSNIVIDTKVTDLNGVIEFDGLTYGSYTLVETKAEGFVIEQPETVVSITKPETRLTIENKENDRSVKLIKTNAGRTQHLQGAVFELWAQTNLMDADGNWKFDVVTGIDQALLTTDLHGELQLSDLQPNTYRLIEVKAPNGYILDTAPVPFEITNIQTETVVVEKTNQAIPVSGGGSSGPYNPGTPTTGVTPDPEKPVTPGPETPGTSIPGTVITGPTEPEDGTEIPTDEDNGVTPPSPGVSNGDDTAPPVGGTDTTDGDSALAPSAGTDTDGSQGTGNSASQGMLPKTGEESTWAFTVAGMMLMALGSVGYVYFRGRQLLQR